MLPPPSTAATTRAAQSWRSRWAKLRRRRRLVAAADADAAEKADAEGTLALRCREARGITHTLETCGDCPELSDVGHACDAHLVDGRRDHACRLPYTGPGPTTSQCSSPIWYCPRPSDTVGAGLSCASRARICLGDGIAHEVSEHGQRPPRLRLPPVSMPALRFRNSARGACDAGCVVRCVVARWCARRRDVLACRRAFALARSPPFGKGHVCW